MVKNQKTPMDRYSKLIKQFIKFGIVGVSNTLVSLAVYYALIYLGAHYLAANTMGFLLGALNSYYWNNRFVFKKAASGHLKTLGKLYISSGATFLLGQGLMVLQIEYLGLSEYFAPVINAVIIMFINFIISRLWVFK